MEPTKEQWFWEQCGLRLNNIGLWCDPDGDVMQTFPLGEAPEPDLNNLFKYAVPKLKPEVIKLVPVNDGVTDYADHWGCILIPEGWGNNISVISNSPDPALALFWAIYKAFGGKD